MKMSVNIEKKVFNELIDFKLKRIQDLIKDILGRWKLSSVEDFLERSKKGDLEESENDAIDLKQLVEEERQLMKLRSVKNR